MKLSKISEPFRFATQSHCEISSFRLSLTTAIFDRYTPGKWKLVGFHADPHEPFETARTGHVSAGEHVLGTLRSAKQATESVPRGWGAGGLVLLWPWMGRQPLPRYLQGRTCRCGSSTCICIASALDPTDPLNRIYQGAQCSAAHTLHPSANYQWLPAAAACFSAVGSPHVGFTRLSMRRTGRACLLRCLNNIADDREIRTALLGRHNKDDEKVSPFSCAGRSMKCENKV